MKRSSSKEALLDKSQERNHISVSFSNYGAAVGFDDVEKQYTFNKSLEKKAATLSIHNICYEVDVKTSPCCGKTTRKKILKNIDGIFKPGMNAILGPTGSGKSSLLDVLAGRKDPKGLTGDLLFDGCPPPHNFKCMVGYVVQDDVVVGTLSVRENFAFSAALRLPASVSKRERNVRIDQVIQELGLTKCADTKVGNEFIRGVSGGERKRTNIGMELIISPPVLFLDEPTTGLDSNTANSVMNLLRRMALKGRTVIFSIHQPRYSIFKLFDNMVLLSNGETVYHGRAAEALDFFKTLGFICEQHNNPSDFFLDVINGDSLAIGVTDKNNGDDTANSFPDEQGFLQPQNETQIHKNLVDGFLMSWWHKQLMEEIKPIHDTYSTNVQNGTVIFLEPVKYATSYLKQFVIVSQRSARNLMRNPQTSIGQVGVMIVFALIVGAVYLRLDKTDRPSSSVQNRVGAFFFIVMNQIFANMSALELFIRERAIFMHENVSGFYRVSSYFTAKIFCDVIPMRLVPATFFCVIVYWMLGLRSEVDIFFFFYLNLFLTSFTAAGAAFFISSSVSIYSVATLLVSLIYVFMMLFGGLLVNLDTIPDWLQWLKWLSLFKYSLDALVINEMKDQIYCPPNTTRTCQNGNDYIESQGILYKTTWDLWQKEVALGAMCFIFMTLTYLQLRRMKKLR